jgi:hypothetical protein
MKKVSYKKLLAIGAALFVLFAPIGITNSPANKTTNIFLGAAASHLSPQPTSFSLSFSFNLAEATTTPTAVGTAAGATSVQNPNGFACATNPATCGVYYVSLITNGAMGLLLVIGAWLVRLGLQFNDNLFNSPGILTGFSVSLAIANLGFVLGIIVIAIATIIRNQTYGIKQLLWKLVVMAILVNFGLVITAPIVGFANSMSSYFINATSPSTATGGYAAYVETMMSAFSPQTQNLAASGGTTTLCQSNWSYSAVIYAVCHLAGQSTTNSNDNLWQNTMGLLFDIAFSGIAAFAFICLGVLLIVRYLMLGGLLIVLPLAWLTFIFPKYDGSFSKWWNAFVKWTFFPPLALFFIYLAFITATNTGSTGTAAGTTTNAYIAATIGGGSKATDDSIESSLSTQAGLVGSALLQGADEILLVGLMIMGLMFANSLSGKAGTTVVNEATNAGKAIGSYVGKRGKRIAGGIAGDRLRTAGLKYNEKTRETTSFAQRLGSDLRGIPGLGRAGSALANYTAPKAVQEERKNDIKKYIEGNLKNLTNEGLKSRATSITAFANPTTAAALAQEIARRDMTNDKDIEPLMGRYVDVAEKMGTAEAVFNNRPDLVKPRMIAEVPAGPGGVPPGVPARMETQREAVARAIGNTKGDVVNVNAQMFNYTNPDAVIDKLGLKDSSGTRLTPAEAKDLIATAIQKLTPAQLGALGSDQTPGSQARQNNLTDAVKEMVTTTYPALRKLNATTGKYEFDNTVLATYITTAKAAGASKTDLDGLANMERIVKHMESSPNWGSVLN